MLPNNTPITSSTNTTSATKIAAISQHSVSRRKKWKPKRIETYHIFIYKLLKSSAVKDLGISRRAMCILDSFVKDIFKRIANEASNIVILSKLKTLNSRCLETATKLCIPGEMMKHSCSAAMKAVQLYQSSLHKSNNTKNNSMKPTQTKARTCRTRSDRSGLKLPVGRISRHLQQGKFASRIGGCAGIYMAGVLESLIYELLELSGFVCKDNRRIRIIPRHIYVAVKKDKDFSQLLKLSIIPQGGFCADPLETIVPTKPLPSPTKLESEAELADSDSSSNLGWKTGGHSSDNESIHSNW